MIGLVTLSIFLVSAILTLYRQAQKESRVSMTIMKENRTVELKNISKKFGNEISYFQIPNLHFEGGKIYALIGTSGCGKTLLNMIGRLEP